LTENADGLRQSLQAQGDAHTVAALAALYANLAPAQALASPFMRPVRMGLGENTFSLNLQELGRGQVRIQTGEATHEASVQHSAEQLHITLNGSRWRGRAVPSVGPTLRWHVQLQGPESLELWLTDLSHSAPRTGTSAQAAQSLRAPFNGKLIALHVHEGQTVKQGDAVLVIESMKLEHVLCAPRDARVHSISASEGQQVSPGQVLVQWKDAT
jgi:3-methylcrotonyl-CoA carboxylase alpha subunit/geranyl-CoA carboxylase alpha subunit